jgi:O-glycosyl hydrolase
MPIVYVSANRITILPKDEKQVIHSFGASDCWTCQFVGKYWPIEKRNLIADLLFSTKTDSKGNPKGIGLSMWRFNIGAGSAEQGDASRISSPWHRAECFQNADGTYDWSKQEGQRWFLGAAKSRGVKYLLAFTISPPVQYTLNGIAHSDSGHHTLNIRKEAMPKFAGFLAEVDEHFKTQGINFDYISPINEPQWGWNDNKQEGSPASNADIHETAGLIGAALQQKGLQSKVIAGEAGALDYLTQAKHGSNASDQIKALWDKSSPDYLAGLPGVAHVQAGHSYFSTWPISKQIDQREKLSRRIKEIDPKLGFWQSEYCILESSDEIGSGHHRDLGMDTALYVARVIHSDLTIADASHWSWWLAVSQADYKDGLVYIESDKDPQRDGRVLASKLLWAMGNFSRFVRPGMVRVGVSYDDHRSLADAAASVMASAYLDKKTGKLVIVLINCTKESQAVEISGAAGEFTTYTTSDTCDLAKGSAAAPSVTIPARSIVTLVGQAR